MKKCSMCKQKLPNEAFGKSNSTSDGLQYYCKECAKRYRNGIRKMKKCSKCGKYKPIVMFYEARGTEDGYFDMCKKCCRTRTTQKINKRHYEKYFLILD